MTTKIDTITAQSVGDAIEKITTEIDDSFSDWDIAGHEPEIVGFVFQSIAKYDDVLRDGGFLSLHKNVEHFLGIDIDRENLFDSDNSLGIEISDRNFNENVVAKVMNAQHLSFANGFQLQESVAVLFADELTQFVENMLIDSPEPF